MSFDVSAFRQHFPALEQKINGHSLVYFDNAASTLKPKSVAGRIYDYYLNEASNIHRGAHYLARQGTENYEAARGLVQNFINAPSSETVVFTRGVTESINLLMYSYLLPNCQKDDVILVSPFEHHANIVPWHLLQERAGCKIVSLPFTEDGSIDSDKLETVFEENKNIKLVSLLMYSNVTGARLDVESVISVAKKYKVKTFVDAAQAVLTETIDVQTLDCDFLTFSGHKMFGPYGIGALYGKAEYLQEMAPFHGGGSMISRVSWDKVTYQEAPHKFEAGTPNISAAIGLGSAIEFIQEYEVSSWEHHELRLLKQLEDFLKTKEKVSLLRSSHKKSPILSFNYEGAHSSDVGELLDQSGIAVRAGHHCAQPYMDQLNISGTVRVSLAPYNNQDDVDSFVAAFEKLEGML